MYHFVSLFLISTLSYLIYQPEYKLVWDEECKIEDGRIRTSFSIGLEADFDEEVMEVLEMMEDEIASQEIITRAKASGLFNLIWFV